MAAESEIRELAKRGYWREAQARVVVTGWLQSGKTLAAYAEGHGVDPARLSRWVKRLQGGEAPAVRFYPVRLKEEKGAGEAGSTIEIELRDGRRIRVPRGFAAEDLRRVLVVLGEGETC